MTRLFWLGVVAVAAVGLSVWLVIAPSPATLATPAPPIPTVQVVPDSCLAALHDADGIRRQLHGLQRVVDAGVNGHGWTVVHVPPARVGRYGVEAEVCRAVASGG